MLIEGGRAGLVSRRGDETPRKAPEIRADVDATNSGGEPSSEEDEPVFSQRTTGAGIARKTITVRPKWRGIDGSGVTQERRYDGIYKTLEGSELHERLPSTRRRDGGSVSTR
jgi:hypothetical protein